MKFILSIPLFFLLLGLNSAMYAHVGGHHHEQLRQWSFINQDEYLMASFLSYKNEVVVLEDAKGNRSRFPLADFSVENQRFILKKYERIKLLNQPIKQTINRQDCIRFHSKTFYIQLGLLFLISIAYLIWKRFRYLRFITLFLLLFLIISVGFKSYIQTSVNTDPTFIESAFAPFKPNVATFYDDTYFRIESLGMPEHQMMKGITNWQQQVPIPQCYTGDNAWSIPLNPTIAETPISTQNNFLKGAIALAANGIPIFNALNNRGEDAFLIGELDEFGGHCGKADDYHYHIAPLSLEDKTSDILPIAFALDGFAIYGSKEPDGSPMETLDANNGHYGTNGVYHYHGTTTYPYTIGAMVGEVTRDHTGAEGQIIPQSKSEPVRPAGTPLNGAVITDHVANGAMAYILTYTLNNEVYKINYDWTTTGQYNFKFVEPDGSSSSQSYNAFIPCNIENTMPNCNGVDLQFNSGMINTGSYRASNIIESNGYVNTGDEVLFYAANSISLNAGFEVKSNAQFSAIIAPCTETLMEKEQIAEGRNQNFTSRTSALIKLQVNPNPIEKNTTVRFYLPKKGRVHLKVYNLNGQVIKQFLDGAYRDSGWHETALDVSTFQSGFYYIVIETQGDLVSKKIAISR